MSAQPHDINHLHRRIAQAKAAAAVMYGETGDAFRNLNDDIQDNFAWLLHDLVGDIEACVNSMSKQLTAAGAKQADAQEADHE